MKLKGSLSDRKIKPLLFIINTAGQAYTWRPVIQYFLDHKREVRIVARSNGPTTKILNYFGLQHVAFDTRGSKITRLFSAYNHVQSVYKLSRNAGPSLVIGFGFDAALTAARLNKPCILFLDDDHTKLQNRITKMFSPTVITPSCFAEDMGKKQIRIEGYKELAYLHPSHFQPDPTILNDLHMHWGEKYVVLRFNSFGAVHDIGLSGFSSTDKYKMVKTLELYAKVFIAAEGKLPEDLESYRLPVPQYRIHHVLNYAQLVITDSGTLSTESAILGTPVLRYSFGLAKELGNFVELEKKYGLMFCLKDINELIQKSAQLVQRADIKEIWAERRKKLLAEKIDVAGFLINFIENYPDGGKSFDSRQLQYLQL